MKPRNAVKNDSVGWRTVTRWVAGSRHLREGMPCQDYGGDRILGNVMIGAIADGAGSAALSDVGAQMATTTLLNYLEESEQWLNQQQASWSTLPESHITEVTQEFFEKAVQHILNAFHHRAEAEGCNVHDFACTLIGVVATPRAIAAMQIGDGLLVVRLNHEGLTHPDYQLVFRPDKGEYANQTTFLTSPDALHAMKTQVILGQPSFICAATDGLESVAIRRADWTPFPPFFKPLEAFMEETPNPSEDDGYLVDFLTSERLNQRTDDDKAVLLCLHRLST